jgi:endonuclease YncB( thermonuclease family)
MNSNMPQDQPPWKPGDIANGHVLGTDRVWRPIQSQAERPWTPGDVANGHVLGSDGVWRPVQPPQQWKSGDVANGHTLDHDNVWRAVPPQRRKSWYQRPMGITGLVMGSVLALGMASAIADGAGDHGGDDSGGAPAAASRPIPSAGKSQTNAAAEEEQPTATPSVKPTTAAGSTTAAKPTTAATPTTKPKPRPPRTYLVTRVVDGDTIDLDNGQTVRLVGIDTPERGQCGYTEAGKNLTRLVLNKRVRLTVSDEDQDRYGRLLRYVNIGNMDAGLRQIKRGFAIARYDSRDGYGYHPRESVYVEADHASGPFACPKPRPVSKPRGLLGGGDCMAGYSPCLPITGDLDCGEIGHSVLVTGSDPYRLDADGDGTGCD